MVKYLIDSDVDFPCSTKRTPIIDMVPNTTADMVNAGCAHNRWLDALCPIILVLFDVVIYSRLFYERMVVYMYGQVIILMYFVCLLAKQHTTFK